MQTLQLLYNKTILFQIPIHKIKDQQISEPINGCKSKFKLDKHEQMAPGPKNANISTNRTESNSEFKQLFRFPRPPCTASIGGIWSQLTRTGGEKKNNIPYF
jgi:hypothetical protein